MTTAGQDRLFVPLTAQAFGWWRSGKKRWEVRRWAKRWIDPHTRPGRLVELRRGYSGPSLWGHLTGNVVHAALNKLVICGVPLDDVAPGARGWGEVARLVGVPETGRVVAFEVVLDPGQVVR